MKPIIGFPLAPNDIAYLCTTSPVKRLAAVTSLQNDLATRVLNPTQSQLNSGLTVTLPRWFLISKVMCRAVSHSVQIYYF